MADVRKWFLYIAVAIVALLNIWQYAVWDRTVCRLNLDNSTVPDSGAQMLAVISKDPFGLILSPGWGANGQLVFQILLASLLAIAVLWILQGGKTIPARRYELGRGVGITIPLHAWRNWLGGYEPIDCRIQTLIWVLVTVPLALMFVAAGATLNFFWDFTHNIPYYPWHQAAHASLAYVLISIWACFDVEEVFHCRYRWKALLLLGILNLLSLYLENVENAMVLKYGLTASMFNNLPDSTFDLLSVLIGGWIALTAYNACQYLE